MNKKKTSMEKCRRRAAPKARGGRARSFLQTAERAQDWGEPREAAVSWASRQTWLVGGGLWCIRVSWRKSGPARSASDAIAASGKSLGTKMLGALFPKRGYTKTIDSAARSAAYFRVRFRAGCAMIRGRTRAASSRTGLLLVVDVGPPAKRCLPLHAPSAAARESGQSNSA